MRFLAHYSSSAGNLYEIVSSSAKRLLIDPGVTWKKFQKALSYDLTGIEGCLCGHSHFDHSKSAEKVVEAEIDLFASKQTLDALDLTEHRRSHIIEGKRRFSIGNSFDCFPFSLQHDAEGALGFVIKDKSSDEHLLYVNDTRSIKQRFGIAFSIISICCNYDKEILQAKVDSKDIDPTLAKRLLTSHMNADTTKDYLQRFCNMSKCTEIHLLHTSRNNLDVEKVRAEFEKEFMTTTHIAGGR